MSYPDELIERVALALASLRAVEYDAATSADCEAARTALDAAGVAELVEACRALVGSYDDKVKTYRLSELAAAREAARVAIAKWEGKE